MPWRMGTKAIMPLQQYKTYPSLVTLLAMQLNKGTDYLLLYFLAMSFSVIMSYPWQVCIVQAANQTVQQAWIQVLH